MKQGSHLWALFLLSQFSLQFIDLETNNKYGEILLLIYLFNDHLVITSSIFP